MNERFCCADCIDVALDDFVYSFHQAPKMEKLTVKIFCQFCTKYAKYHLYHTRGGIKK